MPAQQELVAGAERKIGDQIMAQIRRDPDYLDDPESTEYLNHLGYQLVSVSAARSQDFQFFLVRDPMINAFALPGGFIGVHIGLIAITRHESELAGVLAHEIGHVSQRHIARMLGSQKESMAIQIGALLLAILAARAGGSSGGDLAQAAIIGGQAAAMQQQLNFSRDAEREADRVGFRRWSTPASTATAWKLLRPPAAGLAAVRGHGAGLPAHPPADGRAHRRHAKPFAQSALQAAARSDRLSAGPGPPAGAAGNDNARLARRSSNTSTGRSRSAPRRPRPPRITAQRWPL